MQKTDAHQQKMKDLKQKLKTGEKLFYCEDDKSYQEMVDFDVQPTTYIQFDIEKGEFQKGEIEWKYDTFNSGNRIETGRSYQVVGIQVIEKILNMIVTRETTESDKKKAALDFLDS
ncbi:hypothetical protein [Paenibacillus timonensis]|uniref:hypothetical protein n=1 Tax=Paenibacillus timonensis TaxID=225915 RepID=UPI0022E19CB3|nr:hypothetical protein [Paenibacillus timonensis]